MNKTVIAVILIAAAAGGVILLRPQGEGVRSAQPIRGLPWQIEVQPDANSKVFGLTLAGSTFADAVERLGRDLELAVVARLNEEGTLEAYYADFSAGPLNGKLILVADVDTQAVKGLRERAGRSSVMDSGARKFKLHPDDLPVALQARIGTITFVPTANFDQATALKHFGAPSERVRVSEHAEHLLYPNLGLDLLLDAQGKEVLQYVAPRDFARLREPLRQGSASGYRSP
jgi:hypothetical protein